MDTREDKHMYIRLEATFREGVGGSVSVDISGNAPELIRSIVAAMYANPEVRAMIMSAVAAYDLGIFEPNK